MLTKYIQTWRLLVKYPLIFNLYLIIGLCFVWWGINSIVWFLVIFCFLQKIPNTYFGLEWTYYFIILIYFIKLEIKTLFSFKDWCLLRRKNLSTALTMSRNTLEATIIWEQLPELVRLECLNSLALLANSFNIKTPRLQPTLNFELAVSVNLLGETELYLGLPILVGLSPSMLKSILYHEFGHIKLNHLPALNHINQLLIWCRTYPEEVENSFLFWCFHSYFLKDFILKNESAAVEVRKNFEHEADIFAAKVCGSRLYLKALRRFTAFIFSDSAVQGLFLETLLAKDIFAFDYYNFKQLCFWYRIGFSKIKDTNQYCQLYPSYTLRRQKVLTGLSH